MSPHAAKGMLHEFTVTAPEGEAATAPATDGQIIADDFKFTVPPNFTGQGTFEVVNAGRPEPRDDAVQDGRGRHACRRAGLLHVDDAARGSAADHSRGRQRCRGAGYDRSSSRSTSTPATT